MTQRRIYQDEYPYFVTFNTKEGSPIFEETKYAKLLSDIIINTGRLKRFDILVYQIMPEHVHLMVWRGAIAGAEAHDMPRAQPSAVAIGNAAAGKTISDLMHGIKSFYCKTIRDKYRINHPIFQKRFYTRIINNQKYLETIIEYIKQNPIKAELPEKYRKLPYQYFNWPAIRKLF